MSVKVRKLYKTTWGLVIHHQGKRQQIAVGSQEAAKKAAVIYELELLKGRVGVGERTDTFGEVASRWLETVALRCTESTVTTYNTLMVLIPAEVMRKEITSVTRGDIRDLLLRAHKAGRSKSSIRLLLAVCSGIFGHAIEDGLITTSPSSRMLSRLALRDDSPDIMPLSAAEMAEAMEAVCNYSRGIISFLFLTGCRIGEAQPITWDDIDLRNKLITINKTTTHTGLRYTTKTGKGREIDMSASLCAELTAMLNADKEAHAQGGPPPHLVHHHNGAMLSRYTIAKHWDDACEVSGIGKRRLHDIRHTTASLLLANNAPITYVAKQLGHSSPTMTLSKYAHYIPSESKGYIDLLDHKKSGK